MMIPGEMMVITNYITSFRISAGLSDVYGVFTAMIVPFWVSVFYIYLLRQNFKQIPNELYLAAKVDGKSDWSYLWQVMVPLAQPTIISIFILKLMGAWNSYVWPNLVAEKPANGA
jgi:multiple sugar transport system permease protein